MKILIIRHGESVANNKRSIAGQSDVPLSKRGEKQAELVGKYVFGNYLIDEIYSSDLSRAMDTAKPLSRLANIDIKPRKDLREINVGLWQSETYEDLKIKYPESYGVWLENIGEAVCDGGESVKELSERVFSAIQEIAKTNEKKTVAVFTHATPIRCLMTKLKGWTLSEMKKVNWISNASVSEIYYENEKFALGKIGIDGFLKELKTDFPTRA